MAVVDRNRSADGLEASSDRKANDPERHVRPTGETEGRLRNHTDHETVRAYTRLRQGGSDPYYAFLGALAAFTELRPDISEIEASERVIDLCAAANHR